MKNLDKLEKHNETHPGTSRSEGEYCSIVCEEQNDGVSDDPQTLNQSYQLPLHTATGTRSTGRKEIWELWKCPLPVAPSTPEREKISFSFQGKSVFDP